jgi:glycosyltransferase involved in cell wall biosynthesis
MQTLDQNRATETESQQLTVATNAQLSVGPVCWVLISATPYHDARFSAFAAHASVPPVLLELTDHEPFSCLEVAPTGASYVRRLLRPGLKRSEMTPALLRSLLFQALDEIGPTVVCVNGWSLPGSIETLAWCASRGVPAIVMSESTANDSPRSRWKEAVKTRLLSFASTLLVGGRLHAEYALALGVPDARVFQGYDAVDNLHFELGADAARRDGAGLRTQMKLPERYFLACCRFEAKKNLARLLEAYSMYRARFGAEAWSLVLAGDGYERPALEALVRGLGIEESVHFIGPRSYVELPVVYGLASAFVHASTTEQWGLVVNEAAAAGLPLLVSERCGCAPELVRPGVTGLLFDPYDIEAISAAMTSIASPDTDLKEMGHAARITAREWSPERFANGLVQAVRAALEAPIPNPTLAARLTLRALSVRPLPSR